MKKLKTHEIKRLDTKTYKKTKKRKVILILDNIRSMHNVGSAFRTSDAFLIEKIILGGITATPPHNEIHKSALGAEEAVDWEHFENLIEPINRLKSEGYKIYSIEQAEGSISLENFKPIKNEKICLVFGNEVFGVDNEIISLSDNCIEIPQHGTKHSFNVSVSMGIVLWQILGTN